MGIGAAAGGVKGGLKIPNANERVQHWKAKFKSSQSDTQKEFAKQKLKHWISVARKKRMSSIKSKAINSGIREQELMEQLE